MGRGFGKCCLCEQKLCVVWVSTQLQTLVVKQQGANILQIPDSRWILLIVIAKILIRTGRQEPLLSFLQPGC